MDNVIFVAPLPTSVPCPAYEFFRQLTSAERIAIHTLSQSDVNAYDFMFTLQMTVANGDVVVATDPEFIAAMAYLQVTPSSSPCLTAARATQLTAYVLNYIPST
jgi:hypothetical protein